MTKLGSSLGNLVRIGVGLEPLPQSPEFESEEDAVQYRTLRAIRVVTKNSTRDKVWTTLGVSADRADDFREVIDRAAYSKGWKLNALTSKNGMLRAELERDQDYESPDFEWMRPPNLLQRLAGAPVPRVEYSRAGYASMTAPNLGASAGPVERIEAILAHVESYGGQHAFVNLPDAQSGAQDVQLRKMFDDMSPGELRRQVQERLLELIPDEEALEKTLAPMSKSQLETVLHAANEIRIALKVRTLQGEARQQKLGDWGEIRNWGLRSLDFKGPRGCLRVVFEAREQDW